MAEGLTLRLRQLGLAPDRFGAAFASLALVVLAGAGATAVWGLHVGGVGAGSRAPRDWSPWQPRTVGLRGAVEIAEHVWTQPFRVATHGAQNAARFHAVVVHERSGALRVISRRTLGFAACGIDKGCTLPFDGVNERRRVRRQALALALYSLQYLDFERVLVILPPRPGDDQPLNALLFDRADLQPSLRTPLRETLNVQPPTEGELDGALGTRLDRMTIPYQYSVEQVEAPGDAAPVLALSPLDER